VEARCTTSAPVLVPSPLRVWISARIECTHSMRAEDVVLARSAPCVVRRSRDLIYAGFVRGREWKIGRGEVSRKWTAASNQFFPPTPVAGLATPYRRDKNRQTSLMHISRSRLISLAASGRHFVEPQGFFGKSRMSEGSYRLYIGGSAWGWQWAFLCPRVVH